MTGVCKAGCHSEHKGLWRGLKEETEQEETEGAVKPNPAEPCMAQQTDCGLRLLARERANAGGGLWYYTHSFDTRAIAPLLLWPDPLPRSLHSIAARSPACCAPCRRHASRYSIPTSPPGCVQGLPQSGG